MEFTGGSSAAADSTPATHHLFSILPMATNLYCDGIRRRDFSRSAPLAASGSTLAGYLRLRTPARSTGAKAKSAIFVNLGGGPTHMDTFDLKPDAPAEFRGEFKPIKTNVAGVEISEHLPKLAQCADKYAILRGVSHTLAAHELGTKYLNTGNRPLPSLEFPGYGAVVSKELPGSDGPAALRRHSQHAAARGYLGVQYAPLADERTPAAGPAVFGSRHLAGQRR